MAASKYRTYPRHLSRAPQQNTVLARNFPGFKRAHGPKPTRYLRVVYTTYNVHPVAPPLSLTPLSPSHSLADRQLTGGWVPTPGGSRSRKSDGTTFFFFALVLLGRLSDLSAAGRACDISPQPTGRCKRTAGNKPRAFASFCRRGLLLFRLCDFLQTCTAVEGGYRWKPSAALHDRPSLSPVAPLCG